MLAFLHTAAAHVPTFSAIASDLAPEIEVRHVVRDDLLTQATRDGQVTVATRSATQTAVKQMLDDGARVVVCTCSTLGDAAEATPRLPFQHVLRVDRPMAEHAAATGRSTLVVAATPTALDTALALLRVCGSTANARPLLCDRAWPLFLAGDHAAYAAEVAAAVERDALPGDVVLLAQASMAPAAPLLARLDAEVLTSPRLGVRAALALLHRRET